MDTITGDNRTVLDDESNHPVLLDKPKRLIQKQPVMRSLNAHE
jgi:hypothetical protein